MSFGPPFYKGGIEILFTDLESLIENLERYKAHTRVGEQGKTVEWESLKAHTKLCQKYFLRLMEEKGTGEIFSKYEHEYLKGTCADARELFRWMLFDVITFHDIGKINPGYQRDRLGNFGVEEDDVFKSVGNKHSGVSAILYINYYYRKIMRLKNKDDRNIMKEYLLCNSYVIARHHSKLVSLKKYMQNLCSGDEADMIEELERGAEIAYRDQFILETRKVESICSSVFKRMGKKGTEESIGRYIYVKLLYSLLVASDYYAASEYGSGMEVKETGNLNTIQPFMEIFQQTKVFRSIKEYRGKIYPQSEEKWKDIRDINELRSELYLEAEESLKANYDENVFYLEAPTGSGKSNTAFNLSFRLIKEDPFLKKIYYIYPFNTLVEQNLESLSKVFENQGELMDNIAVVNSITPIKKNEGEEKEEYYQKALLDRQFLNYPIILTTHVSIFDTIFGDTKESAYAFHQLAGSVIVLDEIQSYKNIIWTEMILVLKEMAKILNMKIIIMSATLPDFDMVAGSAKDAVRLISNREKYFAHPCFKNRVRTNYDLMNCDRDELFEHIVKTSKCTGKILVEFIKKNTAGEYFRRLIESQEVEANIYCMTGDDSIIERKRILDHVKSEKNVILVATQVIEAGVDIDMDIGYKNIAKFDSEEQFMGRINRSCKREGMVYFFKLDNPKDVYGEDVRLNKEFTIEDEAMREILDKKGFHKYYEKILRVLQVNYNQSSGERGLEYFIHEQAGVLDYLNVKERMRLIEENNWSMSVYLARYIQEEGIDGRKIWEQYCELLKDTKMSYAKKKVKLSEVTSKMNYFIYQIKKNPDLIYNDQIGDIYYIEDGEKYFEDGKLNRRRIQGEVGAFVDFI